MSGQPRQGATPRRTPRSAAWRRLARLGAGLVCLAALPACLDLGRNSLTPSTSLRPVERSPAATAAPHTSVRARLLAQYYEDREARDLAAGLMRTDGGGPDTPYDAALLARNFETIAFYGEHAPGQGLLLASASGPGILRRWDKPVRVALEFGASVPAASRTTDRGTLRGYLARLAGLTRHQVALSGRAPNFHVLVMGEDDRSEMLDRVRALVPNIDQATLATLRALPREVPCLVMAFSAAGDDALYDQAIAVIRAETTPLLRRACFHEEMAQGLGLPNDSPLARPSVFNDDGEFALLTSHDEQLLRILYDDRLTPGMTLSQARPIVGRIAAEMMPES